MPLAACQAGLSAINIDMSVAEIECILANLIFEVGYESIPPEIQASFDLILHLGLHKRLRGTQAKISCG